MGEAGGLPVFRALMVSFVAKVRATGELFGPSIPSSSGDACSWPCSGGVRDGAVESRGLLPVASSACTGVRFRLGSPCSPSAFGAAVRLLRPAMVARRGVPLLPCSSSTTPCFVFLRPAVVARGGDLRKACSVGCSGVLQGLGGWRSGFLALPFLRLGWWRLGGVVVSRRRQAGDGSGRSPR